VIAFLIDFICEYVTKVTRQTGEAFLFVYLSVCHYLVVLVALSYSQYNILLSSIVTRLSFSQNC